MGLVSWWKYINRQDSAFHGIFVKIAGWTDGHRHVVLALITLPVAFSGPQTAVGECVISEGQKLRK